VRGERHSTGGRFEKVEEHEERKKLRTKSAIGSDVMRSSSARRTPDPKMRTRSGETVKRNNQERESAAERNLRVIDDGRLVRVLRRGTIDCKKKFTNRREV